MSDKKVQSEYTDVKGNDGNRNQEEEFVDSGVVSGMDLSCEQYTGEMQDTGEQKEAERPVARVVDDGVRFDSGVSITDDFSTLSLGQRNNLSSDQTEARPVVPTINIPEPDRETRPQIAQTPLWHLLFQQDNDGDNQLHLFALHGSESGVRAIISACPYSILLDMRNDDGFTPLHMAVLAAHAPVVTILVASGANICIRDCDGNTPLHLATLAGDVKCLKALINNSIRNANHLADALEQRNYEGETCVYIAARAGDVETLKVLVQFGANINSRDGKAGYTALHVAAENGDVTLATFLLRECDKLDPYTRNYAGRTPRRLAGPKLCRALSTLRPDEDSETSEDSEDSEEDDDEMQYSGSTTNYSSLISGVETINVA